ncbi:hypothetical protein ABVK25_011385 [Lepraria finkii]|uniref:Uncharacterized protein n=1 Tax=Lepraria finkii TaxID=1340010 RepID=A0ABR4APW8_9LECA
MPPQRQKRTYKTYDTPQKAKIQGAEQYMRAKGIPHNPRDIFDFFDVEERPGYKFIEYGAPSRTRKNQDIIETRGRKPKLSGADVRETDHLLEEGGLEMEAKAMAWEAIT